MRLLLVGVLTIGTFGSVAGGATPTEAAAPDPSVGTSWRLAEITVGAVVGR